MVGAAGAFVKRGATGAILAPDARAMTTPMAATKRPGRDTRVARRLPIGAEPLAGGGVHFRVWAPAAKRVELVIENGPGRIPLEAEDGGYHSVHVPEAAPGTLYRFALDGGEPLPDPASRWQPEGVHGPSCVIDPTAFAWTDDAWPGRAIEGAVMQEIHIGTFTPEGTWSAAAERLPLLVDVGIDVIEVMPVAEFAGAFGWGYDGVDLWAPTRLYGTPDEMRAFIDRAHNLGIAVILDVVYNHLGPSGNYLSRFAPAYFTRRYANEWGEALNFDGPDSAPVREFFVANAQHWIAEYHLDGLRLDATQQIYDASEEHVVAAIAEAVRSAAGRRRTMVVAENERQDAALARRTGEGGNGCDAIWNDDFHHTARVALTGVAEAYLSDYRGSPQELISAMKWGFLYQGQRYSWQDNARGHAALDLPACAFVNFIENHDQVSNQAAGRRLVSLADPGSLRALTALLLLGPATPLLFQGQEFGATAPFPYFADHEPELAQAVRRGRVEFLSQFPGVTAATVPDPGARETFERARIDWSERDRNTHVLALHRDLIRLRREDPLFSSQDASCMHGAIIAERAFVLRWIDGAGNDRLLLCNLGHDLHIPSVPEPLVAPPEGTLWTLLWSSEDARYGGRGHGEPYSHASGFRIPGRAAIVLAPGRDPAPRDA